MPNVNPTILKWARETAGFTPESAAAVLAITSSKSRTGAEKLEAIEKGEVAVSRTMLMKMADKYHRSLLIFYLQDEPRVGDRGRDFRTRPGGVPIEFNPTLDTLIRDIRSRQNLIRSVLEEDGPEPLTFVGSAKGVDDPDELAERMRQRIGFSLEDFRRKRNANEAFDYLRGKIEGIGVFVLLAGNLGSHHTNIDTIDFGGYAIADTVAPFIVINDHDARSAWSFTALHELAHIFLDATGVSATIGSDNNVERLCNAAAGRVLLPASDLAVFDKVGERELLRAIGHWSENWKLSRAMIAYNLYLGDRITRSTWSGIQAQLRDDWAAAQQKGEERQEGKEGGPSYYVVKRHRLGHALLAAVQQSLLDGSLSQTKASRVLGVKLRNIEPLLRDFNFASGGA